MSIRVVLHMPREALINSAVLTAKKLRFIFFVKNVRMKRIFFRDVELIIYLFRVQFFLRAKKWGKECDVSCLSSW